MYHYHYEIHIFSTCLQFENVLKTISFPNGLSFTADTSPLSDFYSFPIHNNDFIILDFSSESEGHTTALLLEKCSQLYSSIKNLNIILCADHHTLSKLSSPYLSSISDAWITPLTDDLLSFYYTNLMKKIKIEKDFHMTQNYLETTINSIPDLIWYKDIKGAHIKINDGFCAAVGKTKEDCEGRGHYYIWDLKQEEYEKGEYVCLETEEIVLNEKKTCLFDEQVKSKDGMRQFKTYKSPIFDENDDLVGTVGIAHDVTDFDNINTELEIILNSLPFGGLLTDADGKIINVNEKFIEYFRIDRENILYNDYSDFHNRVLALPTDDSGQQNTKIHLKHEEQDLILELQETIIFDVFHNEVGHFCIYRDITEREKHLDFMKNYQKNLEADVRAQVKLNQTFQQNMIISFADIISSRDTFTGGHIKRTSKYVEILVNAMRKEPPYNTTMDDSFVDHLYLSAPLHDIGKISIPDVVLLKPGKYTPTEYEIMKLHANLGGEILDNIMPDLNDSEYYRLSKDMATCHHERWDGTGYPRGLKEEEIPLCARIMAVADVFDALTSKRPYKDAFPIEEARSIIAKGKGNHFDPTIVDIFLTNFDQMANAVFELNKAEL